MSKKQVIVSGVQPTGSLHLGNYLGAVKNWVDLQNSDKYEMYIFVADLHSLTSNMPAETRRHQILKTAAELLACGINPKKTTLFIQSDVTEHTDLGWIFNCVTPISELQRMTQFKDKSARQDKNINAGLFTYPVLQAADILLYHSNAVPVGQDQVQHVELTQDVARWFNNRYQTDYFEEPKTLLTEVPKVMSLLEPEKKMSKSYGEGQVISLADEPEVIEKKLKAAGTATTGGGPAPGVANLLMLLKHFSAQGGSASGGGNSKIYQQFMAAEKNKSIHYSDLKTELTKALSEYFADFRKRRKELLNEGFDELAEIMLKGKEKAKPVAQATMEKVWELVGIR